MNTEINKLDLLIRELQTISENLKDNSDKFDNEETAALVEALGDALTDSDFASTYIAIIRGEK